MKIKVFLIGFLGLFWMPIFANPAEKAFLKVKKYLTQDFPSQFSCELEGSSLKKSLEKIPQEAFLKNQETTILMLFHQKWGSRVLLKGVVLPFEDRFSYIEKIFDFVFPFIQKKDFKDFQENFTLFDVNQGGFKLKKNKTQGSYLEIFFNSLGQPRMVKEIKGDQVLLNIQIQYSSYKKYEVPTEIRVLFYEEEGTKRLKFRLMNFNDKPNITEEDFLG